MTAEIEMKIRSLYQEAENYKKVMNSTNNRFVAETQLGLYQLTINKISKLEAQIQ